MKENLAKEHIQNMLLSCDLYRQVTPVENSHARNIIGKFYEDLLQLKNILEEEVSQESSPLTEKELNILEHVSNGFTNREIASALSLSIKTIEFHMSSILKKTESSSRTEAVKNALQQGWLTI